MKTEIQITKCDEPYAVIFTEKITDEVRRVMKYLQNGTDILIGTAQGKSYILKANEIIKASVEHEKTHLYTQNGRYISDKRLYEIGKILGKEAVQISKSVIVRIEACKSVEADFGGMMLLSLKDGSKEYISRHYLPAFKRSLGI